MKLYDRNFTYIPACSLGGVPDTTRKGVKVNGYVPNWWEEDSFFYWPYILHSAHYSPGSPLRKPLHISDDVVVFGDSGGWQAETQNFDFDPITALRFQEKECNIGMILDKPPVEFDNSWTSQKPVTKRKFLKALDITKKNAEVAVDNRQKNTKYNLKLFNVLQGTNPWEIQKWWDEISHLPLDGWSAGVKPPRPMMVAFVAGFFISNGITENVHLLGLSGMSSEAVAAYACKWIRNIYVDSSSYIRGCTAREYNLPLDIRDKLWLGDRGENITDITKLDEWPCMCPVCLKMGDPRDITKLTSTVLGVLLSMHNLWWYIQLQQQLGSLIKTEDVFKAFVKKQCTKEAQRAIQFLDHCADYSWEEAVTKFFDRGAGKLDDFY